MNSTEQNIREEYAKRCPGDDEHFDYLSFRAGYMALLNELEPVACVGTREEVTWVTQKSMAGEELYLLPERVAKP